MSGCGCCGQAVAPLRVVNRPGLSTLALRVGTHASMLADMTARLSAAEFPALAGLTTREAGDPTMALLDAWAVVGDVLTFYQERIGNEGYLRTATERRSLVELAALVGYRPRPGVAAGTHVAYTIDENSGPVVIPAGSRITSVPGPGETMQTFETTEPLEARREWNGIGVRLHRPQTAADVVNGGLVLAGTATGLAVGTALLVELGIGLGPQPYRVRAVAPDPVAERTTVTLEAWSGASLSSAVVEATVRHLVTPQAFEVDPDGATAVKVLKALGTLSGHAAGGGEVPNSAIADALAVTGTQLALARRNGWGRLTAWLSEGVDRLAWLLPADGPVGTRRLARAENDGFDALLDDLARPGSLPPRSTRQLGRTAEETLKRGADTYPALLARLRPELAPSLYGALGSVPAAPPGGLRVWALRLALPLFGHNAPQQALFSDGVFTGFTEWDLRRDETENAAFLDRDHPEVLAGGMALVTRPETDSFPAAVLTRISAVRHLSRNAYSMAGKSTWLQFADRWWAPTRDVEGGDGGDGMDVLRAAVVHCGAEELALAEAPITDPLCGAELELDGLYDGLRSGRWMILAGERADIRGIPGVRAAEVVMLAGVSQRVQTVADRAGSGVGSTGKGAQPLPGDALHTFVTLASPLAYCYRRDTAVLYGNVAAATHGETRVEVLGGGDPRVPRQAFRLRQPPLTWTSAPTTSGIESSLEVRVDDVTWHEAPGPGALDASTRGFLTRQDDAGFTTVTFGDGVHGARLPSGVDNVRATYRQGLGRAGNVRAGQLSQLGSRPLGVKDVVNPVRAGGGADAEGRDLIRGNVPTAVLALDRLVSTRDHADFARTFAGVAKAAAARLTDGRRTVVHVTIAGVDDGPIDETSDLFRNLREALHRFGDPALPLRLAVRHLLALVISARVRVLPDHHWDVVEPRLRAALLDGFGFDRRELGRDVLASEVIACAQAVRGVDYVDLDLLAALDADEVARRLEAGIGVAPGNVTPRAPGRRGRGPAARIEVGTARLEGGVIQPAGLAYLQPGVPDCLILNEITEEA